MATDIVFPETGESITSGTLTAWSKGEGEWIERDETVAEIETDKITVEVPAPASGLVTKHTVGEGDEIEVGAVIGTIDETAQKPGGGNGSAKPSSKEAPEDESGAEKPTAAKQQEQAKEEADRREEVADQAPAAQREQGAGTGEGVRATPLARKVAEEHAIDLRQVRGTGAGGRIREQDVLDAVEARKAGESPATGAEAGREAPAARTAPPAGSRQSRRERLSPLRQRVASRLVEAQQTAAMLTTFNECDMSGVIALRKRYKEQFEKEHGVGLGFMSFFVKASVAALRAMPRVNAYIVEGDDAKLEIEHHDYCDVAIAVSSPKGLVVPVLRNAEAMSFADIEAAIKDMGKRAQDGKLTLEEMQGGTFTITNGGIFGSLNSTPILNPPQSAILGMHAIKNRPVEDPESPGQIVLRPMMNLALSYDHRLIDGAQAVRFLVRIKEAIEDPQRVMLGL